ncbi:hypothetical protein JCM8547_007873 [Rhodosporidiobolus lusitaniae]
MAPSFPPTSNSLKRRRVVVAPKLLAKRADDGFWTPGMGEAGFDKTASQTLDGSAMDDSTTVFVTVTAPATTVTQLVDSVAPAVVRNPKAAAATSADFPAASTSAGRVLDVASSVGVGKVVQLSSAAEQAAPSSATTTAREAPTSSPAPQDPAMSSHAVQRVTTTSSAAEQAAATTSEALFNPSRNSAIRAVATTSSAPAAVTTSAAASPATSSSSALNYRSSRIAVVASSSSSASSIVNTPASSLSTSVDSPSSTSPRSTALVVGLASASTSASLASTNPSSSTNSLSSSSPTAIASSATSSASSAGLASAAPSLAASLSSSPSFSSSHSSTSSSTSATPTSNRTTSFFDRLGSSPANIALTSIVSAAILAVLLGLLAFLVRRCHRRRKHERFVKLGGGEGGGDETPPFGEPWERFERLDDGSPEMVQRRPRQPDLLDAESPGVEEDEVWRRRMGETGAQRAWKRSSGAPFEGLLALPVGTEGDAPRVEPSPPQQYGLGVGQESRRESASTVGTGILYPSYPATAAFHLPHRLSGAGQPAVPPLTALPEEGRPSMNPHFSSGSMSIYSANIPPTPTQPHSATPSFVPYMMERYQPSRPSAIPLSPALDNGSPTSLTSSTTPTSYFPTPPRREILAHPTANAPAIVRTLPSISGPSGRSGSFARGEQGKEQASTPPPPSGASTPQSWKDALERVMGNAADLINSSLAGAGAPSSSPQPGNDGDRFTAFPATSSTAPLSSPRRFLQPSALRPTRPPPLNLPLASPTSPSSIYPLTPPVGASSPPCAAPSSLPLVTSPAEKALDRSPSWTPSSSSSSSSLHRHSIEDRPSSLSLVSPTTLAFPEKALVLVKQYARAARAETVPTPPSRRGSKPDSPTLARKPFEQRENRSVDDHPITSTSTTNPFVPPRPPRRRLSSSALPSQPRPQPEPTLVDSSALTIAMGRTRSSSLDGTSSGGRHEVSSFSDDSHDSHEGSVESSFAPSVNAGEDGEGRRRPLSVHDRFVGSLMKERRRRSLASLSALSHGTGGGGEAGRNGGGGGGSVRAVSRAESAPAW